MATRLACDSCGQDIADGEAVKLGHAIEREYCPMCAPSIQAYVEDMRVAANIAGQHYAAEVAAARAKHRALLPDGALLPDHAE